MTRIMSNVLNIGRTLANKRYAILLAAVAGVSSLAAAPAPAKADVRVGFEVRDDHRFDRERDYRDDRRPEYREEQRVWVEPVYRTVCDKVYVAPVTQCVTEQVWVPDQFEDR